jgi:acid phosphatase (class A)
MSYPSSCGLLKAAALAFIAYCSSAAAQEPPKGYLKTDMLPDSFLLLPPPPETDSPAYKEDQAVNEKALLLRNTPRWELATSDANLTFPQATNAFSCELGIAITEKETPATYRILWRSLFDAAQVTTKAKKQHGRERPYGVDGAPACTPADATEANEKLSYPSGHTSIGWAWALILAEIAPTQQNAILERGMSF